MLHPAPRLRGFFVGGVFPRKRWVFMRPRASGEAGQRNSQEKWVAEVTWTKVCGLHPARRGLDDTPARCRGTRPHAPFRLAPARGRALVPSSLWLSIEDRGDLLANVRGDRLPNVAAPTIGVLPPAEFETLRAGQYVVITPLQMKREPSNPVSTEPSPAALR